MGEVTKKEREYNRTWYVKNKEERIEVAKSYYKKHRKEVIDRVGKYGAKWRADLLFVMGGKCFRCGFNDWRALQIDHINGGGHKERSRIGPSYWNKVLKSFLDKEGVYQLLCANCNFIKRYENGELNKVINSNKGEK